MSAGKDSQIRKAIEIYIEKFKKEPDVAAFAPGRVNLIGEHTDYNDGFVFPFALPHRAVMVGSRRHDSTESIVYSTSKPDEPATFEVNADLKPSSPIWSNYVKGTVFQYLDLLPKEFAFNAVIVSAVPLGSGLSSSAAIEYVTYT